MSRPQDFDQDTKVAALLRQKFRCASCGTKILWIGKVGRAGHKYGERAHAHHRKPIKMGGTNFIGNCVIICESCHYSVHEGGNYRYGKVYGRKKDFAYLNG